jgi:hypothetical protein
MIYSGPARIRLLARDGKPPLITEYAFPVGEWFEASVGVLRSEKCRLVIS